MSNETVIRRMARADPAAEAVMDDAAVEALLADVLATAPVGDTPRVRPRRVRLAAAAATGLAAVTAIALWLATSVGGGLGSPSAAAAVLRQAAHAASQQSSPRLAAGQFYFVRTLETYMEPIRRQTFLLELKQLGLPKARITLSTWTAYSPTRGGAIEQHLVSIRFLNAAARRYWESLGRPNLNPVLPGKQRISPGGEAISINNARSTTVAALLAMPANPRLVYRRLFAGVSASDALGAVVNMLTNYPLPARVRSALYQALALVPGIHFAGSVRTLTGQTGQAVWAPALQGRTTVHYEVIIDPRTGTLLGWRSVITNARVTRLPAGSVWGQGAIVQRAIANSPQPPKTG